VPEAAVNEDGNLCSRKHDVGFTTQVGKRAPMNEVTNPLLVENSSERHFGCCVLPGQGAHPPGRRLG
jgi:hypothetical protein